MIHRSRGQSITNYHQPPQNHRQSSPEPKLHHGRQEPPRLVAVVVGAVFIVFVAFLGLFTLSTTITPSNQLLDEFELQPNQQDDDEQQQAQRLWIVVRQHADGLTGWMNQLSELMVVARKLNAKLVEPCFRSGTLVRCEDGETSFLRWVKKRSYRQQPVGWQELLGFFNIGQKVRLGDVFDLERLNEFYPGGIVPYEEFWRRTTASKHTPPRVYETCMHRPEDLPPANNTMVCGDTPDTRGAGRLPFGQKRWQALEDAMEAVARGKGPVVLEILSYKQFGLRWEMRYNSSLLCTDHERAEVKHKHLRFKQEHFDRVDQFLQTANLSDSSFSVIHWRAEKEKLNYANCVQQIVNARNNVTKGQATNTPFVLLSSLNSQWDHMWRDTRATSQSQKKEINQALDSLLDTHGFLKVDSFIQGANPVIKDPVFVPVWDLIIAMKAKEFATCTTGCREAICEQCNYLGGFGLQVIQARSILNKTSYECWPT